MLVLERKVSTNSITEFIEVRKEGSAISAALLQPRLSKFTGNPACLHTSPSNDTLATLPKESKRALLKIHIIYLYTSKVMISVHIAVLVLQLGIYCILKLISTDGTSVSLWWICLSTPFIYTLFYIFSYISHTDHTHYLPCVCYLLFIICILCVFYDSIHALIVYVLFRAIPYIIRVYLLSIKVYKVLCHWSETSHLKAWSRCRRMCAALSCLPYGESKTFLRHAVTPTVSIPSYGCPHPFFIQ